LTVAAAIHRKLPDDDIIYLGDTARVPYGIKSRETITRYALESSLFLLSHKVKLIVVACNTVSAVALPYLRDILKAPLIGVLEPGVRAALSELKSNLIGVIGTPSTIESGAYQNRIMELRNDVNVLSKACPLLVPLAEEGITEGDIVNRILAAYLETFDNGSIDVLILGCTHYPLFKPAISQLLGEDVTLIDSAETTATEVETMLLHERLIGTHGKGSVKCFITDVPRKFSKKAVLFFGSSLIEVKQQNIHDLHAG